MKENNTLDLRNFEGHREKTKYFNIFKYTGMILKIRKKEILGN